MKVLLLLAHGSRRQQANDEIRQLAQTLHSRLDSDFDSVEAAFLEMVQPSIAEAIDDYVNKGANQIWLMPYFLAAGRHVVKDIPAILREKQQEYKDINIRLCAYLGASESMAELIKQELGSVCERCPGELTCQYPACASKSGTAPENR